MIGGAMFHPSPAPCLETVGLAYLRERKVVLHDLHLAVAGGETVAVLGDNGAGKSTLLLCLAGWLRPASGQVRWQGHPANQTLAARRLVGFLGHETGLYAALTARENLVFAARLWGLDAPEKRVTGFLADIGLTAQERTPVQRLSRGMQQRLALGRAVLHDPPILLLDEPFTSLDPTGRRWLETFLERRRAQGRATVFTSHDPRHCASVADRLLLVRGGKLHPLDRPSAKLPHPVDIPGGAAPEPLAGREAA